MREKIRRAPQQLHSGRRHFARDTLFDRAQVADMLLEHRGGGHDVHVMKGEMAHSEAREKIERRLELRVGHGLCYRRAEPRTRQGSATEDILSRPVEGVPV